MARKITIEQFSDYLRGAVEGVPDAMTRAISVCCQKISDDIKADMAHTIRDQNRTYYTHNTTKAHHPSAPGNPPAPDTGNLRKSIRFEICDRGKSSVYGLVGSTQKEPPYGSYLECGTSKIAPRPWLRPALEKNKEFIETALKEALPEIFSGGGE